MWTQLDPKNEETFPPGGESLLITIADWGRYREVQLVSFDTTNKIFTRYGDGCGCGCGFDGTEEIYPTDVYAWMLCPEPYYGENKCLEVCN